MAYIPVLLVFAYIVFAGLDLSGKVYPDPPDDFDPHNKAVFIEDVRGKNGIRDFDFGDIVILDLTTRQRYQVTHDKNYDISPCWSPDGQYIIFESKRSDDSPILGLSRKSHIYIVEIKTGKITQVDKDFQKRFPNLVGEETYFPIWNPVDQDVIAFATKVNHDQGFSILQYNFKRDEIKTLVMPGQLSKPMNMIWSPDGKYIAINNGLRSNTFLYDVIHEKLKHLSLNLEVSEATGFSKEAEYLFFSGISSTLNEKVVLQYNLNSKKYKSLFSGCPDLFYYVRVIYEKDESFYLANTPLNEAYRQLYISNSNQDLEAITKDQHAKNGYMIYPH
jgi:WD40 repeat protein